MLTVHSTLEARQQISQHYVKTQINKYVDL